MKIVLVSVLVLSFYFPPSSAENSVIIIKAESNPKGTNGVNKTQLGINSKKTRRFSILVC